MKTSTIIPAQTDTVSNCLLVLSRKITLRFWMIKKLMILLSFITVAPGVVSAVTLPYMQDFTNNLWVNEFKGAAAARNGATVTHITSGCYSGGCAKVTPPTTGNPDGTYGGIGEVQYSGVARIHIRFLIKVGPTFPGCMTQTQGGRGKFILMDYPSRTGMFKFNTSSDGTGKYMAFAVMDDGDVDWYSASSADPSAASLKFRNGVRTGEWICVEYWHDTNTDRTGLYLWTQDGVYNGVQFSVATNHSVSGAGFSFSYWNNYCSGGDSNSYLLFDNLAVSTSFIGPPEGFSKQLPSPPAPPENLNVTGVSN